MDMNSKNNGKIPEKIHRDFLDAQYFTVASIMTPPEKWVCVDMDEQDLEKKISIANNHDIFNLVVTENNRAVGFINVSKLKEKNWKDQIIYIKEDSVYLVPASMSLFGLVEKLSKESRDVERKQSPIYFVQGIDSCDNEPIGIFTYWDLNRAPAYVLSYTILTVIEQSVFLKIRENHIEWSNHCAMLDMFKSQTNFRCVKNFLCKPSKDGKFNYKSLSQWGLTELLTFYNNDNHVQRDSRTIPQGLIDLFSANKERKLRNRIAHSENLLVEDEDRKFQEDLNELCTLWNEGRKAFIQFEDQKISHNPIKHS